MIQPTIQPLFNSRQFQDSLLVWLGRSDDYYSFLKNYWAKKTSWNKAFT